MTIETTTWKLPPPLVDVPVGARANLPVIQGRNTSLVKINTPVSADR